MLKTKVKQFYQGKRYLDLWKIAESALFFFSYWEEFAKDISCELKYKLSYIGFKEGLYCITALDYSMSTLEAFITHLGCCIDPEWAKVPLTKKKNEKSHEKKLLHEKYERVRDCLIKLDPYFKNLQDKDKFTEDFRKHRDKRNKINHIPCSMYDWHYEEREDGEMYSPAIAEKMKGLDVSANDAESAFKDTKDFIEHICAEITKRVDSITQVKAYKLHSMSKRLDGDSTNNPASTITNAYVFTTDDLKLYYFDREGKYEEALLKDIDLFKNEISYKAGRTEYTLDDKQIEKAITFNGGHSPPKVANSTMLRNTINFPFCGEDSVLTGTSTV